MKKGTVPRRFSHLLASILSVVVLIAPADAAETTGGIHGIVVDPEGTELAGAQLELSSEVLIGGVHRRQAGADGTFGFRSLPPGEYLVRAELEGYVPVETATTVRLNRRTDLRIEMPAAAFEGEITVEVPAEPVQMDLTRVHVGETFDREFLDVASIGMDGRSVVGIIGKEAGVQGGARPRIMGSTYSENVFLVDGLNTTDPLLGTISLEINFDALQEIEVYTGSFEAEYGQALGGVINAVTKSGGNRVSGTVDLRYRDENLAESGDYFDPDRDPTSSVVGSATIGGPVVKDRLWFFASLLGSERQLTRFLSLLTEKRTLVDALGKLTWQAAPNHRLTGKVVYSSAETDNLGAVQYIAEDAGERLEERVSFVQANLNSVLSDSLLLDVQLGATSSRFDMGPVHGDNDIEQVYNWTTGIVSGSSGIVAREVVESLQLRSSLTGLVDGASGNHEIKGGVEFREMRGESVWYRTGFGLLGAYVYDPTGVRPGYGHYDEDGDGLTDTLALVQSPEASKPVEATGTSWSFFLQDDWRPTPRLTVKPGLRYDGVTYQNKEQKLDIATLGAFQPRLGVAWDLTGKGRHVLRANVGRYMHPAALSVGLIASGRRAGDGEYYGYELWCSAGLCDHDYLESLFGPPIVRIDPEGDEHIYYLDDVFWYEPFQSIESLGVGSLDTPRADQFMVGTEHRLWESGTLELIYLRKKTGGLIEDTCNVNSWMWGDGDPPLIDDPSTHNDVRDCQGYVLANAPDLERDYKAVMVKLESRGRRLQLFANYTWSVSEGSTEATADWAFSTFEYDLFPRDFLNIYGYLSDDQRHRVKIYGYVLLPWNFNLSFDARWASGIALDRTIDCGRILGAHHRDLEELGVTREYWYDVCAGANTGEVLFEPRGSRRGEETYQLDLQLAKGFGIGRAQAQVILTVTNVFSSEQPAAYEEGELEVLPWGTPLAYQQPRRWEVGLRLEF
ncbi:MAG: TonB-dependent receptor [Thermoanaerobaculales bacterium]|jgi:hypothetical protein|nr:TonB-dependent receptor [Thermoanaerobaculales bacterium]